MRKQETARAVRILHKDGMLHLAHCEALTVWIAAVPIDRYSHGLGGGRTI
ncbi:MAG TPA: hypothetical protein VMF91_19380 [Bryobacteraceae bacterium]|nr:hypothetical protein [Bryobacteraceae bacterium]